MTLSFEISSEYLPYGVIISAEVKYSCFLKSSGSFAAFVWQSGTSHGLRRKCFGRTWAWNVARCVPRRPCRRGPSAVATRHDCQGSPLEAGAISPGLITRDLRLTCQSFPHTHTLLSDSSPRGTSRSPGDERKSEAECRIRSEILKKKKREKNWERDGLWRPGGWSCGKGVWKRRCLPPDGDAGKAKSS